jgi:hypothetical protein
MKYELEFSHFKMRGELGASVLLGFLARNLAPILPKSIKLFIRRFFAPK